MHLLARDSASIDAQDSAVDLAQSPGEIVFLSFSDSDLSALFAAHDALKASLPDFPSLRLASLARLKHPYSIDLYLEKTIAHARFVLIRCLGGADYWRYGVDEVAALCRQRAITLAIVPGDHCEDIRLNAASTSLAADVRLLWRFFQNGGPDNMRSALGLMATRIGCPQPWRDPEPVTAAMRTASLCRNPAGAVLRANIVFYRSFWLSADIRPFEALADALAARSAAVETLCVTSLKDPEAADFLTQAIKNFAPDVIINTTAFSAREKTGGALDLADAPVLQASLGLSSEEAWRAASRGLGAADLAMNVVLPEYDGRILGPFLSFKAETAAQSPDDYAKTFHQPVEDRVNAIAALAIAWAKLRQTTRAKKRIAMIFSNYPARGGREGYAVGLDTPASAVAIAARLRDEGFGLGDIPDQTRLMQILLRDDAPEECVLSLADYARYFATLPKSFQQSVIEAWGDPQDDSLAKNGAFAFRAKISKNLLIAVQPDRGASQTRRADYHDGAQPPRHAYIAFYCLLRRWKMDVMTHLGTHGTLEYLPGKPAALSADCAPQILLGDTPVVYPFIVNDPGEAAQARRRLGAVTIGHMTPPLIESVLSGAAADIENLLDEYSAASGLDSRRANLAANALLDKAEQSGVAGECGLSPDLSREEALMRLDSWLCDIKELRIGDGLHVFGAAEGEWDGLLKALDGRFVRPGPSGAPSRARKDVLPTGRNLYSVDPRAIPTRAAFDIGQATARDVLARYVQDHGDWPRALIINLWGGGAMRTGGDDLAQAMALIGVRPTWDHISARVSGFEIVSAAELGRPRVDVTLRISGLFSDVFPAQIALYDQAVRALAARDEDDETNPFAAAARRGEDVSRVFGAAPQTYGMGLAAAIAGDQWGDQAALGQIYLDAGAWAYDGKSENAAPEAFAARVRQADALVHGQDMAETDVLAGPAFAEHQGGFLAASRALGGKAAVYHVDATTPDRARVRALKEEIARIVRGRLASPRWLEGQMRHGFRGAAEISEGIGNLVVYAAAADLVDDALFELAYAATWGDERVKKFLWDHNPEAAKQMARDFAMALQRGLWRSRRNSLAHDLGIKTQDKGAVS